MKTLILMLIATPIAALAVTNGDFSSDEPALWQRHRASKSIDDVRRVALGMTRYQVYQLLGTPHDADAIRSKTWRYAFYLTATGSPKMSKCDLRLVYLNGHLASRNWEGEKCAELVG